MDTIAARFRYNPMRGRDYVQMYLCIPAMDAQAVGVEEGKPFTVRNEGGDLVFSPGGKAKWRLKSSVKKPAEMMAYTSGNAVELGLTGDGQFGDVELRVVEGELRFRIDEVKMSEGTLRAAELADMPDLREATRGLHGGAYALVQDNLRRPECGQSRPLGVDAAVDMLREAGYRVERTGAGCWRIDDKSFSRADLSDLVRKVDADAVLVAA